MKLASTAWLRRRRSSVGPLTVSSLALVLYVWTLLPDLGGPEDTPKFQFLGYVLGTAHPPGYPLYVLLSHLFVMLPIGTIAYRANLFSAVMAAGACGLAYAMSVRIGCRRWAAVVAVGGLATGLSFWRSAVFAEVYSLAALMVALTVLLVIRWGKLGHTRDLLAATCAFGLGLGNHLTIIGVLPAVAIYVLVVNRRVITLRFVMAALAIVIVCISQYAFILVRTTQGAPYLESSATSLKELVAVVTAERFATERFAFSVRELITVKGPAVLSVIGTDLGAAGALLLLAGVAGAIRRRNREAALVGGAAIGIFAMVINLEGDISGFITSLLPLVWVIAALGIDASARAFADLRLLVGAEKVGPAATMRVVRTNLGTLLLCGASAVPLVRLAANYQAADQSHQRAAPRFFRSLYAELPTGAAFVAEDYFVDMVFHYLKFTREAGEDKGISRINFTPRAVRESSKHGRRVFALGGADTWFAAEGLRFERTDFGRPLEVWLQELPAGSVVVGAAARAPVPWALFGEAGPSVGAGRPRAATVFAHVVGRPDLVRVADDKSAEISVDGTVLQLPGFTPGRAVMASANEEGAYISSAGRILASIDSGNAIVAFAPDGALLQAFTLTAGQPAKVPLDQNVYEFKGEGRCADVTEQWTDMAGVLSTGSWVSTLRAMGTVTIEQELVGSGPMAVRAGDLAGTGGSRTVSSDSRPDGSQLVVTELLRTHGRRPVFRFALDRPPLRARARLRSGAPVSSLLLCAHVTSPLFPAGSNRAVVGADYDAEPYFGPAWSAPQRTPNGFVRRAEDDASLLLPLAPEYDYRLRLDVAASPAARFAITANGLPIGTCAFGASVPCELHLASPAANASTSVMFTRLGERFPGEGGVTLTFRDLRMIRLGTPASGSR